MVDMGHVWLHMFWDSEELGRARQYVMYPALIMNRWVLRERRSPSMW